MPTGSTLRSALLGSLIMVAACDLVEPSRFGPAGIEIVPRVDTLEVSIPELQAISPKPTTTLRAIVHSADGTELDDQEVVWSSLAPEKASVDGSGEVVAVRWGDGISPATVPIEARVGEFADTATIVVFPPVLRILTNVPASMVSGREVLLEASLRTWIGTGPVREQNGLILYDPPVAWSSSDTSVIAIDEEGIARARRAGISVVTVTSIVGRSGSTTVTVVDEGYTLTVLGTLGGAGASINAMNDRGEIVGISQTATGEWRATLWRAGEVRDLSPFTGARDINESGEIAGDYVLPGATASSPAIWRDGQISVLPATPPEGAHGACPGEADALDDIGHVAIRWCSTVFRWRDGVQEPVPDSWYRVNGVNSAGTIVGELTPPFPASGIWQEGDVLRVAGGRAGSRATAINNRGEVVGHYDSFAHYSYFWAAGEIQDLGHFGGVWTQARDLNDQGYAVGSSRDAEGSDHGFIYRDGALLRLTELLQTAEWEITDASAINNHGQIAATARDIRSGNLHPVLLTPTK